MMSNRDILLIWAFYKNLAEIMKESVLNFWPRGWFLTDFNVNFGVYLENDTEFFVNPLFRISYDIGWPYNNRWVVYILNNWENVA